jgi:DNA-binding MarR family transcriptional regulator
VLLVALGRQVEARLDEALAPAGLSLRLMGALGHLARQPGLSYTELAARARVTPQSMHATVASLIEAGAVSPAGTGRGRRALLEVTPRGHRLLAAGQEAVAAVDAELRALGQLPSDGDLFRVTTAVARRAEA